MQLELTGVGSAAGCSANYLAKCFNSITVSVSSDCVLDVTRNAPGVPSSVSVPSVFSAAYTELAACPTVSQPTDIANDEDVLGGLKKVLSNSIWATELTTLGALSAGSGVVSAADTSGGASCDLAWRIVNSTLGTAAGPGTSRRRLRADSSPVITTVPGSADPAMHDPVGIVVDASGTLFVADDYNHDQSIHKITSQGVFSIFADNPNQGVYYPQASVAAPPPAAAAHQLVPRSCSCFVLHPSFFPAVSGHGRRGQALRGRLLRQPPRPPHEQHLWRARGARVVVLGGDGLLQQAPGESYATSAITLLHGRAL